MATSSLPVLALPHPIIFFPSARVTLTVSKPIGEALLALLDTSDSLPIVAAVPVTSPPHAPTPNLAEWGTASRVLRLTKPPSGNTREPYVVFLQGLTRVHLLSPLPPLASLQNELFDHEVEYASTPEKSPDPDVVVKFKEAALLLLDRLARDSTTTVKRERYVEAANVVEDVSDQRAPLLADILVGSLPGEYSDKLGMHHEF